MGEEGNGKYKWEGKWNGKAAEFGMDAAEFRKIGVEYWNEGEKEMCLWTRYYIVYCLLIKGKETEIGGWMNEE